MGKLFLVFTVLLAGFLCVSGLAEKKACPKIEMSAPTGGHASREESFPIDVIVEDYEWEELKFEWTLSENIPFRTQGEPVIFVAPDEEHNGLEIEATVKIEGLPQNCRNSASIKIKIRFPGGHLELASYEKLPFSKEKAELDTVASSLKSPGNENSLALFIIHYEKKDTKTTIKKRILRISEYLIDKHELSKERFDFVIVGPDENRTTVYQVRKGKDFDNLDWEKSLESLPDKSSKKTN